MKKRMVMLAIGAMLAAALIAGGAYAYFSDTETSSGNQFSAGSLDLVLGTAGSMPISFINMVPGSSGSSYIQVQNQGSIVAELRISGQNLVDAEGMNYEPETNTAEPGDLSSNVDIEIFVDANANGLRDAGESLLWSGKLNAFNGATVTYGEMAIGATVNIGIYYSVPTTVGNEIMGDTVTFDIVFVLQQV
ncbi:MAG: TasA family protein [Methanomassiliicoccales archaeon]